MEQKSIQSIQLKYFLMTGCDRYTVFRVSDPSEIALKVFFYVELFLCQIKTSLYSSFLCHNYKKNLSVWPKMWSSQSLFIFKTYTLALSGTFHLCWADLFFTMVIANCNRKEKALTIFTAYYLREI